MGSLSSSHHGEHKVGREREEGLGGDQERAGPQYGSPASQEEPHPHQDTQG